MTTTTTINTAPRDGGLPAAGELAALLADAALLRFLALLLLPPAAGRGAELAALAATLRPTQRATAALLAQRFADELEEVEAEYHRLFGGGGGVRDCESDYAAPTIGAPQALADVAAFYGAFSFAGASEMPAPFDHLATELSFASYLALKEAYAQHRGADLDGEVCRAARQQLVAEHLRSFAGQLHERLAAAATPAGFFAAAADFIGDALQATGVLA